MALPRVLLTILLLAAQCTATWAVRGVRVSDLKRSPTPANPIKTWGKVVSETPVKISDGKVQIEVTGIQAKNGDFLIVQGDWNGTTLALNGPATAYVGLLRTEMVYVAGGSFQMGNSLVGNDLLFYQQGYQYCYDEVPPHTVSMPSYWIAKYEVTRGDYQKFIDAGGYTTTLRACWSTAGWNWKVANSRTQPGYWAASQNFGSGTFTQVASDPVVGVTWYEAEAYCNWAGGRLPTEAEWEKAGRWTGSHPNIYPWGDDWDADKCNNRYDHNPAGGGYDKLQTTPVGSYQTGISPYGCRDMAGNVWEWCSDWYQPDYYAVTPTGGWNNPQGPSSSPAGTRSLRGGGWIYGMCGNSAICCRCANRSNAPADYTYNVLGFRLGRSGS